MLNNANQYAMLPTSVCYTPLVQASKKSDRNLCFSGLTHSCQTGKRERDFCTGFHANHCTAALLECCTDWCIYCQEQHADSLTRQHIQMSDAKKLIEELKADRQTTTAAAKHDLAARGEELARCREVIRQTQAENDALKAELEQARQSGTLLT